MATTEITHDTPAPTTFPFPVTLTPTQATIYVQNRPASIDRSSPTWNQLVELIQTGGAEVTEEQVLGLISPARFIANELRDTPVVVRDGAVWYGEEKVDTSLAEVILSVVRDGLDPQSWLNFATKVYANPSEFARQELYEWLIKAKMPIAPDGDIYAYKRIRQNYRDCHTGTIDNSVGQVVEMPREKVDPNRRNLCSYGLHFCSLDYLGHFHGDRVVLVKINPADVVSIPVDYRHTKGRTSRYEVVEELTNDLDALKQVEWSAVVDVEVVPEDPSRQPRKVKKASKKDGGTAKQAAKAAAKKRAPKAPAKQAAPAKGRSGKKVAGQTITVVESAVAGRITKTRYRELVREHGTDAAIARHFKISSGTVRSWKTKLGL